MQEPAQAGELIGSIYEAGMDGSRWPAFMDKLRSALNAGFGNLWLLDKTRWSFNNDDSGDVCAFSGLDAATVGVYKDEYAKLNVWLPNALDLPEGALTVSSALYPDHRLKGTEFYDVFLRPNDLFYAVGSSVAQRGTTDVRLSFVRAERAGRYSTGELRLLQDLMPHLRNAVVLHRELYRSRALAASAMQALELLPVGVILLTPSGRVAHANRRAHDLCARSAGLRLDGAGGFRATAAAAHSDLERLVRDAIRTATGKGLGHGGSLRLRGPGGRLQVLVTPLGTFQAFGDDPMAAIFCSDPDAAIGHLSQSLESMYGMTPAEALLAEALVSGKSLQEYAESRSVTMNTVRTQLKSAMAKAGARRQADLVRIVLTGPAVFRRPD
ncbi:helix-turn-helix transcriptional regulator [Ramlibacter sp. PS4R-6]|uniref:helix-turn-helix transcriptional regulator n=1 Tax=Ramlibacter sp. PS4R-6 TaxID=3133438 RepID=UPI0030A51C79